MENEINQDIKRNDIVTSTEIEDLRIAIGWDPNKEKYETALKSTYAQFSLKKDGKLIVFARVVSDGILYSFIVDLIVHPDFQKKGIGKIFIKHVVSELTKDGLKFIQLTFDKELEPFYRSCGFEIIEAGSIKNN